MLMVLLSSVFGCAQRTPPPPETAFDSIFAPQSSVAVLADSGDALVKPTYAAVLGDDLIVVDIGAANLKVINRQTGMTTRVIGGPGDETGDFRQPLGIAMLGDSTYGVLDHKRRVVSVRHPASEQVDEMAIDGAWNGIAPSPRAGHFVLAGTPATYVDDRTTSLHEYDLNGHQTASCGVPPKTDTPVEASFSTPFLARLGKTVLVARYNSNRVQMCSFEPARTSTVAVAPEWYKPIDWPKRLGGQGTGVQRVTQWAAKQRLMSGLFALREGRFIAQFQMSTAAGEPRYNYVVADTSGHTLAISETTDRQILTTRGDTLYWIERAANAPAHIGVSVHREQVNAVVAQGR